jgi:hypothetical protein
MNSSIQSDAGELLIWIHRYPDKHMDALRPGKVMQVTRWDPKRIDDTIDYLRSNTLLKIINILGKIEGISNFKINDLSDKALLMMQDKRKFQKQFGFEPDFDNFRYSWES